MNELAYAPEFHFKYLKYKPELIAEIFEAYRCEGCTVASLSRKYDIREQELGLLISRYLLGTKPRFADTITITLQSQINNINDEGHLLFQS